jgi:hypothetical protein
LELLGVIFVFLDPDQQTLFNPDSNQQRYEKFF